MSRRILFATAVFCVIFGGAALAADISGTWSGSMQTGDNPYPLTFAFKQDGEKLIGTVNGPQGQPLPLNEGKVLGDKVTFFVRADMDGAPAKFLGEGIIKGDEIALSIKVEGGEDFGVTALKRVK